MRSTRNNWLEQLRLRAPLLTAIAAAALMGACSGSSSADGLASGGKDGPSGGGQGGSASGADGGAPAHTVLDDRKVDYNEALRTASLKLVRALPSLEQIKKVQTASDPKAAYEAEVDAMFADTRFQERMIDYWKDVMRMGGDQNGDKPSRDTAPIFAARMTAEGRPYTDLFTAAKDTCPTYDGNAHKFVSGDCNNNVPAHAGVLTNPGVQYQFFSNMAFRRVRWTQEIFVCTKFPAEYSDHPVAKGSAEYVSPWKFESVSTAPINFQDTSSVICANCHTTINHIAPLFAHFDDKGNWSNDIQVMTPTAPDPVRTELSHYLSNPQEQLAWRLNTPITDLASLGQAMANDPDVAECAVARAWNFVMSKEDIVSDLATVPKEVLQPFLDDFKKNGMNLKQALQSMFKSDDFVRF